MKNTSDIEVFIRAYIVVNYVAVDGSGDVFGMTPVIDDDYYIEYGDGAWAKGSDGFYYYTEAVAAGESTGILIESCAPILSAPDGYRLTVQVLATAIQASPDNAVEDAFGVTNNGGIIVP